VSKASALASGVVFHIGTLHVKINSSVAGKCQVVLTKRFLTFLCDCCKTVVKYSQISENQAFPECIGISGQIETRGL